MSVLATTSPDERPGGAVEGQGLARARQGVDADRGASVSPVSTSVKPKSLAEKV